MNTSNQDQNASDGSTVEGVVRNPAARRFGRSINSLPALDTLINSLPIEARHHVYTYLVEQYQLENLDDENLGVPLCDGKGNTTSGSCPSDALHGAQNALNEYSMSPAWSNVLSMPLSMDTNIIVPFEELFDGDRVRTIYADVCNEVEEHEHSVHALGLKLNRRYGYSMAKAIMFKRIACLFILYSVPMVSASPLTSALLSNFLSSYVTPLPVVVYAYLRWMLGVFPLIVLRFYSVTSKPVHSWVFSVVEQGRLANAYDYKLCEMSAGAFLCWLRWFSEMIAQRGLPGNVNYADIYDHTDYSAVVKYTTLALTMVMYLACACFIVFCKRLFGRLQDYRVDCAVSASLKQLPSSPKSNDSKDHKRTTQEVSVQHIAEKIVSLGISKKIMRPPPIILEMALNGSSIGRTTKVDGILLMASVHKASDGTIITTPIGLGFRYADYFVTANHNLEFALSKPGSKILVPFVTVEQCSTIGNDYYTLPLVKNDAGEETDIPDFEQLNIVTQAQASQFDIAILKLSNKAFSKLAVKSISSAPAAWGGTVAAKGLGLEDRQYLHGSIGSIRKNLKSPLHRVEYTCSTLEGWSGGPILSGRKVVAVHTSTNGEVNYGTNFELVKRMIDLHQARLGFKNENYSNSTSPSTLVVDKAERIVRDQFGHESDFDDFAYDDDSGVDIGVLFRNRHSGRVSFRERIDFARYYDSDTDSRADSEGDRKEHAINAEPILVDSAEQLPVKNVVEYEGDEDFRAVSAPVQKSQEGDVHPPASFQKFKALEQSGRFKVSLVDKQVSAPVFSGIQEQTVSLIDFEKAKELGYEEGKFRFPPVNSIRQSKQMSSESLLNHLKFSEKVLNDSKPVDEEIRLLAKKHVISVLEPAAYKINKDSVTVQRIREILGTSAISGSKSPGLPFTSEGLTSNAAVIEQYGDQNLAELVHTHYVNDTWVQPTVNFIKLEPTKPEKLDADMPRVIQSTSLITRLVVMCHLAALQDRIVETYRKHPIMCGFSPLKVGDADFMLDKFKVKKDQKLIYWDGKSAEYTWHDVETMREVTDVFVALARPQKGMTEDEFEDAKDTMFRDLQKAALSPYYCSNGILIEKLIAEMLASGQFDTFVRNSVAGLLHDARTKLEMGYSLQELKKEFVVSVGGDDNMGRAPKDFDLAQYKSIATSHGVVVHKEGELASENGMEFFSFIFSRTESGLSVFKPVRFSKHLEGLKATPMKNLGGALLSHMTNWVHDAEKFQFFRDLYLRGQELHPALFPDAPIPDRKSLINHLRGCESAPSDLRALLKSVILTSAD